jgi:Flp pilus assembly protein TadD
MAAETPVVEGKKVTDERPLTPYQKVTEGMLRLRHREYEEAVAIFTEVLATSPNMVNVHRYRAKALEELGRLDEAEADLEEAKAREEMDWGQQPRDAPKRGWWPFGRR